VLEKSIDSRSSHWATIIASYGNDLKVPFNEIPYRCFIFSYRLFCIFRPLHVLENLLLYLSTFSLIVIYRCCPYFGRRLNAQSLLLRHIRLLRLTA